MDFFIAFACGVCFYVVLFFSFLFGLLDFSFISLTNLRKNGFVFDFDFTYGSFIMKKNLTYDLMYALTAFRRSPSGDKIVELLLSEINYLEYLIYVKENYK